MSENKHESSGIDGALKHFDQTLKINPQLNAACSEKGIAFDDLDQFEKAIKCYDKAILLKPEYKFAWYKKVDALKELDKYQEADTCLEKWLELNSDYLGWYKRGLILLKLNNLKTQSIVSINRLNSIQILLIHLRLKL